MFDDDSDQYGFWNDEPTRPLERITARRKPAGPAPIAPTRPRPRPSEVQVGRRQHSDTTQQLPVVSNAVAGVRQFTGHVDPLLRRMGAIAVVVALCVPVAMALRSGNDRAALAPDGTTLAVPGAPATEGADQPTAATDGVAQIVAQPNVQQSSSQADVQATAAAEPASSAAQVAATTAGTTPTPPSASQPKLVQVVTPQATSCTKRYTVVAGDYWILIAKKVSVTTKELLAANHATTSTALYPGRSVCLPANASAPTTVAPTTTVKATTTTVKATTTTVKVTTTTAAPVPPKRTYTKAEVAAIIRQVWPDNLEDEAVRIATRESNLVPGVRNYCCYGLFQIYYSVHRVWLNQMGVTSAAQLYDPMINAYVAYALYLRAGGWGPWKL